VTQRDDLRRYTQAGQQTTKLLDTKSDIKAQKLFKSEIILYRISSFSKYTNLPKPQSPASGTKRASQPNNHALRPWWLHTRQSLRSDAIVRQRQLPQRREASQRCTWQVARSKVELRHQVLGDLQLGATSPIEIGDNLATTEQQAEATTAQVSNDGSSKPSTSDGGRLYVHCVEGVVGSVDSALEHCRYCWQSMHAPARRL
jgi:hypothetical protein